MKRMQFWRLGYTLIEVMIVLVILAVVAGSVVQVTYSTNADRSTAAKILKSILEQARETAIANNGHAEVDLKTIDLKVKLKTESGDAIENNDLSAILGTVPTALAEFQVPLVTFAPQLSNVTVKGELEDGSNNSKFTFIETGALKKGKDIYVTLEADHFTEPVVMKINAFTGLIEIQ